jgi:hypothetical protein
MTPTRSRTRTYPSNALDERTSFLEAIAHPDFVAIAIFCALGFLVTLNVLLRSPGWAAFLT